jgi:MFS family permease
MMTTIPPAPGLSVNPTLAAAGATWALLLGMGLLMVGNGLQSSLLGLRASLEGFGTTETGVVMSGYFLGFLLGSVITPKAVASVGHVRVFAALASLASVAILIQGVFVELTLWGAMRVLTGFSYAGLYIVAESWLNGRATNATRGGLIAVYMAIVYLGAGGGQLLLNLADPGGLQLFILTSVLISLALVPILLSAQPAPEYASPEFVALRRLYRISPLGVVGCFLAGAANGAMFGMGAVYGGEIGLTVAQVSFFMGAVFVGGIVFQWPIGRLSDLFDRRRVIVLATFAAALVALAADLAAGRSQLALLIAIGLFGGPHLAIYSLCVAHTNDYLEPRQIVAASSGLVLVTGLGAIIGPAFAGSVMASIGPSGFFWYLAVMHAAIGVFAIYRMTQRAAPSAEDQGPFVALSTQATAVASASAQDSARSELEPAAES